MREWTVHEVLYLLEPMSPLLAIRVASTLAYSAVPPLINLSTIHDIYLIHDGVLAGKSISGHYDPEMLGTYVSQAARDLKLGIFNCRVICAENDLLSLEHLSVIALKVHDDAVKKGMARRTHILIFWSFRDACACDTHWVKIESVITNAEANRGIDNALRTLETFRDVGNVVLVGPGDPVLFGYPANSPRYRELSLRFRVAWDVSAQSSIISYPLKQIIAGCMMSKWGCLQKTRVNIGRVASSIAFLATMSTLCAFGDCEMSAAEAKAFISSRSPKGGVKPSETPDPLAALTAGVPPENATPPPPGHAPPPDPSAPDEAIIPDDEGEGKKEAPAKEAASAAESTQDAEMGQASDSEAVGGKLGEADEAELAQLLDAALITGAGRPFSEIGYRAALDEQGEAPATEQASSSTLPRQTLRPQRVADRIQFGPLNQSDPRFAQYSPQPTAIAGRGTAHDDRTGVTYGEARVATAALVRKLMKETDDAERLEALTNVLLDKPATESGARPSTFYPDGDLSVDAATECLSARKKRADSNSQMMREMESTAYVATLFDRYSGNVISAMDARWVPEYGNRGELEAAIGAVISGLDGAMAQVAHMPVVHPHIPSTYGILRSMLNFYQSLQTTLRYRAVGAYLFNQLALSEDDLRMPTDREQAQNWPDALAQTPIAVIQSLRTHLFANLSVSKLRPDQVLPPGFEYQPRVRTFRSVDDVPILDGVNLSEEQVGQIYPAGVEIVGPSGSMPACR